MSPTPTQVVTLAAGCFWCVEAIYAQIPGVQSARSGFMGGHTENPTYRDICTTETGHAEVVQLVFDPEQVTLETILDWFWRLHDPTTLNRQGADVGTQYRSAIFAHSEEDLACAQASLGAQDAAGHFPGPIVTQVLRAEPFYAADASHDDYYQRNKEQGYCRNVIAPKLRKLELDH